MTAKKSTLELAPALSTERNLEASKKPRASMVARLSSVIAAYPRSDPDGRRSRASQATATMTTLPTAVTSTLSMT